MKRTRFAPLAALVAVAGATVAAFLTTVAYASGIDGSYGTYTDGAGIKQAWRINGSHTLIWGDAPFVPVGGVFQARSWGPGATPSDLESDVQALRLLKAHHINDVYLRPPTGVGLTEVGPAAIQALVDQLDALGFTYGISIDDGPREPLSGYVVLPGKNHRAITEEVTGVDFDTPGIDSYIYYVVTKNGLDILSVGEGKPLGGKASVSTEAAIGNFDAYLIPKVGFTSTNTGSELGFPNLWDGFDSYRDNLLALFRGVHLGRGFRFFADPLPPNLSVSTMNADKIVPTSSGFTTEWTAYLGQRYKTQSALEQAWGVLDHEAKSIEEDAQFVPLWGGGVGSQFFYDRVSGERLGVDTQRSRYWSDLKDFKTRSIQRYMNDLAVVLKRAVADVPVVYRSSGHSDLLSNLPAENGFDGLGIAAYGRGEDLVRQSAGDVYAQAAESPRALWLPVIATADAAPGQKAAAGYTSAQSMHSDFDYLREIGARGFYVDSLHVTDPARQKFDLSTLPDQLTWLSDYGRMLVATGIRADDPLPTALFYPRGLPSATLRPMPHGWLLPTDRPSFIYDFGPVCSAYALNEDSGVVFYLYRPSGGARTVNIHIPKPALQTGSRHLAWYPAAAGELHKDTLTLTVGPDPVRILNLSPYLPVPNETFHDLTNEAEKIVQLMKKRNVIEVPHYSSALELLEKQYTVDRAIYSILEIKSLLNEMRSLVASYRWYEAESDQTQTFDERTDRVGASGGRVLRVDTRPSGAPPAVASFDVEGKGSQVEVWAAASPDAPLTFSLDGRPLLDQVTVPRRIGATYADGALVWTLFGTATVPRGHHVLQVRASGPATLDVVLLTPPGTFTPDGINQPSVLP